MKLRFLLKRKGGKGATHPIYLAIYSEDQTELIYTGYRIKLKDWSLAERAPVNSNSIVSIDIHRMKDEVDKLKSKMLLDGKIITPFQLKQEYLKQTESKNQNQQKTDKEEKLNNATVSSLIEKWIKTGMSEYLPSTKRTVLISINQFKEYLKFSGQLKLEKKDLNSDLIREYAIDYLQKKRKLADSTHSKRMKHLRLFLKWAKIDVSVISEMKIRTIKPSERNIITLSIQELEKLEKLDVSDNKDYQRSKDMFLLGCYTGWRISDLKRINKHRIENNEINITLQKNRKQVSCPILSETEEILKRYDYSAPKISEQQVNKFIKIVCEKAGIDKPVFLKQKRNGVLIESLYPKHKLITTHVAGKTFISLAPDKWGFTPSDVAAFVGKDIKTILGYYLKPDQDNAKQKML
ncbi:MAG: tyrosine-type recombinase/integrase, partial [Chryseotalea sp.]